MSVIETMITEMKDQPEQLQALLFILKKMEHGQKVKNNVKVITEKLETSGVILSPKFNPF